MNDAVEKKEVEIINGIRFEVVYCDVINESPDDWEHFPRLKEGTNMIGYDRSGNRLFVKLDSFFSKEEMKNTREVIDKFALQIGRDKFKFDIGYFFNYTAEKVVYHYSPEHYTPVTSLHQGLQPISSKLSSIIHQFYLPQEKDKMIQAATIATDCKYLDGHYSLLRVNNNVISRKHTDDEDVPDTPALIIPIGTFQAPTADFLMHNIKLSTIPSKGLRVPFPNGSIMWFAGTKIAHSVSPINEGRIRHSLVWSTQRFTCCEKDVREKLGQIRLEKNLEETIRKSTRRMDVLSSCGQSMDRNVGRRHLRERLRCYALDIPFDSGKNRRPRPSKRPRKAGEESFPLDEGVEGTSPPPAKEEALSAIQESQTTQAVGKKMASFLVDTENVFEKWYEEKDERVGKIYDLLDKYFIDVGKDSGCFFENSDLDERKGIEVARWFIMSARLNSQQNGDSLLKFARYADNACDDLVSWPRPCGHCDGIANKKSGKKCDSCPVTLCDKCVRHTKGHVHRLNKKLKYTCELCMIVDQDPECEKPANHEDGFMKWTNDHVHQPGCFRCRIGGVLVLCDGCNNVAHPYCVGLKSIPEDNWFCPDCLLMRCGVVDGSVMGEERVEVLRKEIVGLLGGVDWDAYWQQRCYKCSGKETHGRQWLIRCRGRNCFKSAHPECEGLSHVKDGYYLCQDCTHQRKTMVQARLRRHYKALSLAPGEEEKELREENEAAMTQGEARITEVSATVEESVMSEEMGLEKRETQEAKRLKEEVPVDETAMEGESPEEGQLMAENETPEHQEEGEKTVGDLSEVTGEEKQPMVAEEEEKGDDVQEDVREGKKAVALEVGEEMGMKEGESEQVVAEMDEGGVQEEEKMMVDEESEQVPEKEEMMVDEQQKGILAGTEETVKEETVSTCVEDTMVEATRRETTVDALGTKQSISIDESQVINVYDVENEQKVPVKRGRKGNNSMASKPTTKKKKDEMDHVEEKNSRKKKVEESSIASSDDSEFSDDGLVDISAIRERVIFDDAPPVAEEGDAIIKDRTVLERIIREEHALSQLENDRAKPYADEEFYSLLDASRIAVAQKRLKKDATKMSSKRIKNKGIKESMTISPKVEYKEEDDAISSVDVKDETTNSGPVNHPLSTTSNSIRVQEVGNPPFDVATLLNVEEHSDLSLLSLDLIDVSSALFI